MEIKELAEFYKVTRQSVEKWTTEKRKQKTVQALANAEQSIVDLIADISKLVFIFNCKWLHGEEQVKCQEVGIEHNSLMITGTEFWNQVDMHGFHAEQKLQSIKTKLEELVYGVQRID